MRKNYPKNSNAKTERYAVQYVCLTGRPDIKRIVHHPMKTIFINTDAWPLATKEEVVRY